LFLEAQPGRAARLPVVVRDMAGRPLQSLEVLATDGLFPFRLEPSAGLYLVEVGKGVEKRVFRVVKR
jgi:hypothetical protein